MTSADLLVDAFGRVREAVHDAIEGLNPDELAARLDPEANSIAWLVWHLTRVQDDHLADAFGQPQLWESDGWDARFALPYPPGATGYAMSPQEVGELSAPAELLRAYHQAVAERTLSLVAAVGPVDLARVVDEGWDPPVTLAVRLVSVVSDDLQHVGQAAFVRGMAERRDRFPA